MAVKVIESKPDHSVVKQVICGHCGAKLEYVPADVKEQQTRDYTGDTDSYHYVECPQCSARAHV